MPTNNTNNTINIGLTLDGSVSAGAYIAGVLDYLFEALDAWEDAKKNNQPATPTHRLNLQVITGASGGGITGAVSAVMCFEKHYPISPDKRDDKDQLSKNRLYNTWINLVAHDMVPVLLGAEDLTSEKKVVSLLDSSFIETLARNVLTYNPADAAPLPPYIDPELLLVMSLSNLEGFKYQIPFSGIGSTQYAMTQHRDYGCFRFETEYRGDGWIPLNPPSQTGMTELTQAAPATSAFPIGLAYRLFERQTRYILDNELITDPTLTLIDPDRKKVKPTDIYGAYFVDGGLLNNEPFDVAEHLLQKKNCNPSPDKNSSPATDQIILMVQPFPSDDFVTTEKEQLGIATFAAIQPQRTMPLFPYSLGSVIGRVYTTMRTQLRFKPDAFRKAVDPNDYSRFIIAPRRDDGKGTIFNGSIAIACGALDGFSGFIEYEFRRHDFFLGRKNAQGFIQKYFCVPADANPIVKAGYADEATYKAFAFQDPDDKLKNGENARWWLPLLPDLLYKDKPEPPYPWPVYNLDSFDQYKGDVVSRIRQLIDHSVEATFPHFLSEAAVTLGEGPLYRKLKALLGEQLKKWKLIP